MRIPMILLLVSGVMVSSCATVEQQAAQMTREADRLVRVYGPACEKLGFQSGTDPWRHCLLQFSASEETRYYDVPRYGYSGYFSRYGPY